MGRMPPDPGEAIGLQLLTHRQGIDRRSRLATARVAHLLADTKHGLDMMTDFVGHHIGLGKIPRRAELTIQIPEETQVQVYLAIGRAVEGADRRTGTAAGG